MSQFLGRQIELRTDNSSMSLNCRLIYSTTESFNPCPPQRSRCRLPFHRCTVSLNPCGRHRSVLSGTLLLVLGKRGRLPYRSHTRLAQPTHRRIRPLRCSDGILTRLLRERRHVTPSSGRVSELSTSVQISHLHLWRTLAHGTRTTRLHHLPGCMGAGSRIAQSAR